MPAIIFMQQRQWFKWRDIRTYFVRNNVRYMYSNVLFMSPDAISSVRYDNDLTILSPRRGDSDTLQAFHCNHRLVYTLTGYSGDILKESLSGWYLPLTGGLPAPVKYNRQLMIRRRQRLVFININDDELETLSWLKQFRQLKLGKYNER